MAPRGLSMIETQTVTELTPLTVTNAAAEPKHPTRSPLGTACLLRRPACQ